MLEDFSNTPDISPYELEDTLERIGDLEETLAELQSFARG